MRTDPRMIKGKEKAFIAGLRDDFRRYFHVMLCLFLIGSLNACASLGQESRKKEAETHYRLGVSKLNENQAQKAYIEFRKAVELNPDDKRSHNALGLIYLHLEDYKRSEESFMRAVGIDPTYPEAYNNLGVLYARLRLWNKSVYAFKKALSNHLYASPERAYYNLGISLYRLRRHDEAIISFKEALKRSPDFNLPHYGLALSYNAKHQYGYAVDALSSAIRLDPRFKGDMEKARTEFRENKMKVSGFEEKDRFDFLEILHY